MDRKGKMKSIFIQSLHSVSPGLLTFFSMEITTSSRNSCNIAGFYSRNPVESYRILSLHFLALLKNTSVPVFKATDQAILVYQSF
jgi:hypothetical protein